MGLGITRASICSAVADSTGDDSTDAIVKINRLINQVGPEFCQITNWPFLRSDVSFSITTSTNKYSGASYLPATFKHVIGAFIIDGTTRYPLVEVGIKEAYLWPNPADNSGVPEEFCITRNESGFWEIIFNRYPSKAYTVYLELELQWTDLTAGTDEAVITKQYLNTFSHFVSMSRLLQQGDTEAYVTFKNLWDGDSPNAVPRQSILGRALAGISSPIKRKRVTMDPQYMNPTGSRATDYQTRGHA